MSNEVVYEEPVEARVSSLVPMTGKELVSSIVIGASVGVLIAILYHLLNEFVFGAILCRPQSIGDCSRAPGFSMTVALIIASIGGVAGLARIRIYRPLLIVLASAISLWGLHSVLVDMVWYWTILVYMVLFGLVYGLFSWVARIRNLILTIVAVVVLVVLIRWVLVA